MDFTLLLCAACFLPALVSWKRWVVELAVVVGRAHWAICLGVEKLKQATNKSQAAQAEAPAAPKPARAPEPVDIAKQVPAGINSASANYHMRADGQNTGNFITDRPSTKVLLPLEVDPLWTTSSVGYLEVVNEIVG
ncbi:Protein SPIRAL1-like 2 [Hibiscus syriacus]|uniref:Protein SPIRAL1-like 2 n=1 Tax=Hibiscus syriacus TaxID=106335 RepID=A0A6A2ZG03_HIBSY|nr:Protein SPIRAL1-like 2 [Hibiscus syriacus]